MKQLYEKIVGSFDTNTSGASARKLTAFAFMLLVVFIHCKYVDKDNAMEALMIDSSMILLLLGLVTFEQILALKNGKNEPPTQ